MTPAQIEGVLADLCIPYFAQFWSMQKEDGQWVHRGEYPELGISVESAGSELELVEELEIQRARFLIALRREGKEAPPVRSPVPGARTGLSMMPVDELVRRAQAAADE